MLFTSGLVLFYTALVVPIQIFLWENNDPCTLFPTLRIDLFVDTFFLVIALDFFTHYSLWHSFNPHSTYGCSLIVYAVLQFEVFVHFFVGIFDSSEKYCDNLFLVVSRYLTTPSGFAFNLITSIPWSFIDLNSYQVGPGLFLITSSCCVTYHFAFIRRETKMGRSIASMRHHNRGAKDDTCLDQEDSSAVFVLCLILVSASCLGVYGQWWCKTS